LGHTKISEKDLANVLLDKNHRIIKRRETLNKREGERGNK
jgi:hypothetical protein